MEIGNIIPHIEALIFASDKPLTSMEITELINNAFGFMEEKLTLEQIQTSLDGIVEKYASEFYPFEVRESGGGWQFLTKKDFHKTVAQLNGEKFLKRLSSAALETLAIIAYKQPITKGEVEAIRGVSSDYSIQKLLEKELIIISGRNEDMPGKPLVYSTSKTFMDYFGINSAADLPKLKEVFAETIIEPTVITHGTSETLPETEEGQPAEGGEEGATEAKLLIVGEDGQLAEHAAQLEERRPEETRSEETEPEEGPAEEIESEEGSAEEHVATDDSSSADQSDTEGESSNSESDHDGEPHYGSDSRNEPDHGADPDAGDEPHHGDESDGDDKPHRGSDSSNDPDHDNDPDPAGDEPGNK